MTDKETQALAGVASELNAELDTGIAMKTKRLDFEWIKTGEQYGYAASAVTCFGHSAKIHSTDKGTWTCIVDKSMRENGIRTEQAAKDYAEAVITCKISKRIDKAVMELKTLTDFSV